MIKSKKKLYFERKLHENIAKPKELWKAIKSLGLPCKNSAVPNIFLKDKNGLLNFGDSSNANTFKKNFENLANDLNFQKCRIFTLLVKHYYITTPLAYLGIVSNFPKYQKKICIST